MLNEVLGSVVSGRPIWRGSLSDCQTSAPKNETMMKQHNLIREFISYDEHSKVG